MVKTTSKTKSKVSPPKKAENISNASYSTIYKIDSDWDAHTKRGAKIIGFTVALSSFITLTIGTQTISNDSITTFIIGMIASFFISGALCYLSIKITAYLTAGRFGHLLSKIKNHHSDTKATIPPQELAILQKLSFNSMLKKLFSEMSPSQIETAYTHLPNEKFKAISSITNTPAMVKWKSLHLFVANNLTSPKPTITKEELPTFYRRFTSTEQHSMQEKERFTHLFEQITSFQIANPKTHLNQTITWKSGEKAFTSNLNTLFKHSAFIRTAHDDDEPNTDLEVDGELFEGIKKLSSFYSTEAKIDDSNLALLLKAADYLEDHEFLSFIENLILEDPRFDLKLHLLLDKVLYSPSESQYQPLKEHIKGSPIEEGLNLYITEQIATLIPNEHNIDFLIDFYEKTPKGCATELGIAINDVNLREVSSHFYQKLTQELVKPRMETLRSSLEFYHYFTPEQKTLFLEGLDRPMVQELLGYPTGPRIMIDSAVHLINSDHKDLLEMAIALYHIESVDDLSMLMKVSNYYRAGNMMIKNLNELFVSTRASTPKSKGVRKFMGSILSVDLESGLPLLQEFMTKHEEAIAGSPNFKRMIDKHLSSRITNKNCLYLHTFARRYDLSILYTATRLKPRKE